MSSREEPSKAGTGEKWTVAELVREILLILSASAGVITLLMVLKGLEALI